MHSFFPFSSRSRRKMKAQFWLSTISWTRCVSQSSPSTAGGSATSTLTPVSSLTSESWTGSTELSSWCLTSVKNPPSQISPPFESYRISWKCWWARAESTTASCCKSLVSRQRQERVWWFSTPLTLGLTPNTPNSATSLRRPVIWVPWTYFINANMNRKWHSRIKVSQQQSNHEDSSLVSPL